MNGKKSEETKGTNENVKRGNTTNKKANNPKSNKREIQGERPRQPSDEMKRQESTSSVESSGSANSRERSSKTNSNKSTTTTTRTASAPPTEQVSNITTTNKQPNTSSYRNQQYQPANPAVSHMPQPMPEQQQQSFIPPTGYQQPKSVPYAQQYVPKPVGTEEGQQVTVPPHSAPDYRPTGYNPAMRGGRGGSYAVRGGRGGAVAGRGGPMQPSSIPYYPPYAPSPYYGYTGYNPNYQIPTEYSNPPIPPYIPDSRTQTQSRPASTYTAPKKKVLEIINPKTGEKIEVKPKATAVPPPAPAEVSSPALKPTSPKPAKEQATPVVASKESKVASPKPSTAAKTTEKPAKPTEEHGGIVFGDFGGAKSSEKKSPVQSPKKGPKSPTGEKKQPAPIQEKEKVVESKPTELKTTEPKAAEPKVVESKTVEPTVASPKETATPTTKVSTEPTFEIPPNCVYSFEFLRQFKEKYTELVLKENETWPSMEIINDGPSRRQNRGGGGGNWSQRGGRGGNSGGGGRDWSRSKGGRGNAKRGRNNLTRSNDRWVARKAVSNLEASKKLVQGILNKMTREKFENLASQLTEMKMESLQMLREVIKLIFAKAINEPHFCDMYADLCTRLQDVWKVWSFLQVVQNDDDEKFYWTTLTDKDAEVIGPFESMDEIIESVENGELVPSEAPANLEISELHVRDGFLVKVWKAETEESGELLYWSRENIETLENDSALRGPHTSKEEAYESATKITTFKRILLNSCQEEFEKDNIYEDLEKETLEKKAKGELTAELETALEEKKSIIKFRMLGNIRFIGELYKKGMLQERIMHSCICKLLDLKPVALPNPKTGQLQQSVVPVENSVIDEEKLESCCKLLSTMGKNLENAGQISSYFMPQYFDYIAKMSKDKKLSSRIRFLLQDLIDLRKCNWQPRRKELQQKKLSEIRKDVEKEQQQQQQQTVKEPASYGGGGGRFTASNRGGYSNYQRGGGVNGGGRNVASIRNVPKEKSMVTKEAAKPPASDKQQFKPSSGFQMSRTTRTNSNSGKKVMEKSASEEEIKAVTADLTEEQKLQLGNLFKSNAQEYHSLKDKEEMRHSLEELFTKYPTEEAKFVYLHAAYQWIMEKCPTSKRAEYVEYLEILYKEDHIKETVFSESLAKYMVEGTDLWIDIPKIQENIAQLIYQFSQKEHSIFTLEWILTAGYGVLSHQDLVYLSQEGALIAVATAFLQQSGESAKEKIAQSAVGLYAICQGKETTYENGLKIWIEKNNFQQILGGSFVRHLLSFVSFIEIYKKTPSSEENIKAMGQYFHHSLASEEKSSMILLIPLCLLLINSNVDKIVFEKLGFKTLKESLITALVLQRYYTFESIEESLKETQSSLSKLVEMKVIDWKNLSKTDIETDLKVYITKKEELEQFVKLLN